MQVKIIHSGSGTITESDVMLAVASKGIILGFNAKPDAGAKKLAETEKVEIRQYSIIYNLIEDVEKALKGMLEPVFVDVVDGHAEVRQIFKISRLGNIAGCYVLDGTLHRNDLVRVMRGGEMIADTRCSEPQALHRTTCARSSPATSVVSRSKASTPSRKATSSSSTTRNARTNLSP